MKKCILSFLLGALMFGTVGVYAAGGNMIEVFYSINKIVINKVPKMPEQKPFVHNGSIYVPLQFISENLDIPVEWDGTTQTVYIGERKDNTEVYPGGGIEAMNIQKDSYSNKLEYVYDEKVVKDNIGNEYNHYITMLISGSIYSDNPTLDYMEFPLNTQFTKFKAKIGLTEKYKSTTEKAILRIYNDDKIVLEKKLEAGIMPEEIEVDVRNCVKMKIEVSTGGTDWMRVGLFDARFIK